MPSSRCSRATGLLVRREHGEAVRGIAAVNQRALETIQTISATGITRPAELAGRRVALNPTPRGLALLRHLVALDGGDPDALVIVDSGLRELSARDIAAGAADATFGGYWAWDVLFGEVPPAEHLVWPVDEIGAPPYHGYLLGAREQLIDEQPDTLAAFLQATRRGFSASAADPELARSVLERVIPYFPADVLGESLRRVAPTWFCDGRWGVQRAELLGPYAAWLAEHGVLRSADGWERATTNDLFRWPSRERPLRPSCARRDRVAHRQRAAARRTHARARDRRPERLGQEHARGRARRAARRADRPARAALPRLGRAAGGRRPARRGGARAALGRPGRAGSPLRLALGAIHRAMAARRIPIW